MEQAEVDNPGRSAAATSQQDRHDLFNLEIKVEGFCSKLENGRKSYCKESVIKWDIEIDSFSFGLLMTSLSSKIQWAPDQRGHSTNGSCFPFLALDVPLHDDSISSLFDAAAGAVAKPSPRRQVVAPVAKPSSRRPAAKPPSRRHQALASVDSI
ncbi:hypothetical protein GUJ93_ZPchr0004g38415 [Zizania palustris]|uniref:Uncharacterized protein n=1 Tax=Zizania palustris TaxID=103762 RepID=A0A8J5T0C1_ZIZPA|nr:hypothetical protein GUJ93_ZPchr0004g38415 [Zizania palustris]